MATDSSCHFFFVFATGIRVPRNHETLRCRDIAMHKLRKPLFILLALLAIIGTVTLDFFLPEKSITTITGVEVKLTDKDGPISKPIQVTAQRSMCITSTPTTPATLFASSKISIPAGAGRITSNLILPIYKPKRKHWNLTKKPRWLPLTAGVLMCSRGSPMSSIFKSPSLIARRGVFGVGWGLVCGVCCC